MERFFMGVIQNRKKILAAFIIAFVVCALCRPLIAVNYDMNAYLPEDVPSSVALDVMEEEFDGGIPNVRVMIRGVSIPEALEYKEKLLRIDGVTEITWLDDAVDVRIPLEMADADTSDNYYVDDTALYSVTLQEEKIISAVADIRELIGDENAMTGSAVSTALATNSTVSEIRKIAVFAVFLVFVILVLTTNSWLEPIVVLIGLGVAVLINAGSNLIFGEISFVTNAAGNILQLAVSLDYSVFLIHRFEECRKDEKIPETAMRNALVKSVSSIMSSGLTTVIGFLALAFMRFQIGPDLGYALAKGIAISLVVVFIFMPGLILMTAPYMDKTKHKPFMPDFHGFGKAVRKMMLPLTILFTVMIVPSYLASIHNSYYYGASHIFAEGTQMGDDTKAIEEVFGKSDTYVLMVPKGDTATETKMLADIKKLPEVSGAIAFVEQAGAEIPYEYLDEEMLGKLESEHYSRMVLSVDADYEGDKTFRLIENIREIAQAYYPDGYHLAGQGISTYDLMDTVTADMMKVNLVAIAAVFLVLLITMKSVALPVILVLTIETAIWMNLSFPYYADSPLFYIAYLIISSIQLGVTVDYEILLTERYKENRCLYGKKDSIVETLSNVSVSILTSGIVLTIVGFLLGEISTHGLLSQLGFLLGRGTICSLCAVLLVLPGFLYLFDRLFIKKNQEVFIMNKRRMKTTVAVCLSVMLVISQSVSEVEAAEIENAINTTESSSAALSGTEKEEVVYAMLSGDGTLEGAYVVNSFTAQDITDYGNYTKVKNLTTTDEIHYEDGQIRIQTDADKLYYQGDLDIEKTELPWDIDIRYFMDGKEYSAAEIAGMSGSLKMLLSITQNMSCESSFWEGYALQATMSMDSSLCRNIQADGATIANVGSDKQLSYIILPGKGDILEITADVVDFEMGEISINGTSLNLNIKLDTTELTDKLLEIRDAAEKLDDGTGELEDGTKRLEDGADGLEDGAKKLKKGADTLNDGIQDVKKALGKLDNKSGNLTDGSAAVLKSLNKIKKSLDKVNMDAESLNKLSTASTQIQTGIGSLVAGLQTVDGSIGSYYQALSQAGLNDVESFVSQHNQAIAALEITDAGRALYQAYTDSGNAGVLQKLGELVKQEDADAKKLYQEYQASGDSSVLSSYVAQMGKRIQIESLLKADVSYIQGSNALISGMDAQLDKETGNLMKGALSLQSSYREFDKNIQGLTSTLQTLITNMTSLQTGINKLVKEYKKLNTGISEYTDGVNKIVKGYQKLSKGSSELAKGTSELYDGTSEMLAGILELHDGTGEMQEGTGEFREKTKDIDSEMQNKVDDKVEEMTGSGIETGSFTSGKNAKVDSVLFVMKIPAIEIPVDEEAADHQEEVKEISVIQKILDLFGFGK